MESADFVFCVEDAVESGACEEGAFDFAGDDFAFLEFLGYDAAGIAEFECVEDGVWFRGFCRGIRFIFREFGVEPFAVVFVEFRDVEGDEFTV